VAIVAETCCCCCSWRGGDLDVIVVVLVVPTVLVIVLVIVLVVVLVIVIVVSPSPSPYDSSDTVCEEDRLASPRRRPPTLMPSAPVREGPRIVCVYLSFVAPGKPEMLRGRVPDAEEPSDSSGESGGLGGKASSGHFVASASEAAVM
jgi:hypothetical protein